MYHLEVVRTSNFNVNFTSVLRYKACENQGSEGRRRWLLSSRARKEKRKEFNCLRRRHTVKGRDKLQ